MGLSLAEQNGIVGLLKMVPPHDLIPFVATITNGLVKTDNPNDAIQAILKYCKDSLDILKRKKITKDLLFRYLKESKVEVSPRCDKTELIHKCLNLWQVSSINSETIDWEMCEMESSIPDHNSFNLESYQLTDDKLLSMGTSFSKWFYNLLRDVNNPSVFGPQHFWSDCMVAGTISTADGQNFPFSANGDRSSIEAIRNAVNHFQYLFEPNLFKDINCYMESHGLIKIHVNGVIYKSNSQPDGVFESAFGLIKNPHVSDDNWKIKYIEMHWKVNCPSNYYNSIVPYS